jgi:hypothetical protein
MFGEERDDMLELWGVGPTSGDLPFSTDTENVQPSCGHQSS